MKQIFRPLFLSLTFALLAACTLIEKGAINKSISFMKENASQFETQLDMPGAAHALDGQIVLLESLRHKAPQNFELNFLLTKAYVAQALLFAETEYLSSIWRGQENILAKERVQLAYSQATSRALSALGLLSVQFNDLLLVQKEDAGIPKYLDQHLERNNPDHQELIFLLAQALGGLANLLKDRPLYMGNLPIVQQLMGWICQNQPDYYFGSCAIFDGVYFASRPKLFGGDPALAKASFLKAIETNPGNIYAKLAYLQFYLLPMEDQSEIDRILALVATQKEEFTKAHLWNPMEATATPAVSEFPAQINLLNAVSLHRFHILSQRPTQQKDQL